jgi:hypothetical protein
VVENEVDKRDVGLSLGEEIEGEIGLMSIMTSEPNESEDLRGGGECGISSSSSAIPNGRGEHGGEKESTPDKPNKG